MPRYSQEAARLRRGKRKGRKTVSSRPRTLVGRVARKGSTKKKI